MHEEMTNIPDNKGIANQNDIEISFTSVGISIMKNTNIRDVIVRKNLFHCFYNLLYQN
jgi:hypothetical protein